MATGIVPSLSRRLQTDNQPSEPSNRTVGIALVI
jgi:hypothetical protein